EVKVKREQEVADKARADAENARWAADIAARNQQAASELQAADVLRRLWRPGQTLHVYFLDGAVDLQGRVLARAADWTKYGNIRFERTDDRNAPVRVSFRESGANYSFRGRDVLQVSIKEPTMMLGGPFDRADFFSRAVLREFGFTLGLLNETNNPNANIPWNL